MQRLVNAWACMAVVAVLAAAAFTGGFRENFRGNLMSFTRDLLTGGATPGRVGDSSDILAAYWARQREMCATKPDAVTQSLAETLGRVPVAKASVKHVHVDGYDPTVGDEPVLLRVFTPPGEAQRTAWAAAQESGSPAATDTAKLLHADDRSLGLRPGILFAHGGGFVICGNGSHDDAIHRLALLTNAVVVAVEYAKAPENPWPAAAEDTWAALRYLGAHGRTIGVSPRALFVAGDSAGGNLAAVAALWARDGELDSTHAPTGEGSGLLFPLLGQVLVYPVTNSLSGVANSGFDQGSVAKWGQDSPLLPWGRRFLTEDAMRLYFETYLGEASPGRSGSPAVNIHPYHSPLFASSHLNLPPALVVLAEVDVLRDDGLNYAEALRRAGVHTTVLDLPNTQHAFWNVRSLWHREVWVLEGAVRDLMVNALIAAAKAPGQGALAGTSVVPSHKECPVCPPPVAVGPERTPADGGTLGVEEGAEPPQPEELDTITVAEDGMLEGDLIPPVQSPGEEYFVEDSPEAEAVQEAYRLAAAAEE